MSENNGKIVKLVEDAVKYAEVFLEKKGFKIVRGKVQKQ